MNKVQRKSPLLSTKARTLASLKGLLSNARIQSLASFTVADWQTDNSTVLVELTKQFKEDTALAVRSSALKEDTSNSSLAGRFVSFLNVQNTKWQSAIEDVIAAYGSEVNQGDEILVQQMLSGVSLSGVAFSHDPATGSPYRIINYCVGSDTTLVTGGAGETQTFVASSSAENVPKNLVGVIALIEELQSFFPMNALDIEFAIADEQLFLLQVRPLVFQREFVDPKQHHQVLKRVENKIRTAQRPHPFLQGNSTVFGVMPDWNPAEIIGIRPRPLALSLYRELITDAIWAYQRDNYGYRNLRSFPLLVNFSGQPYIDVRLSFNSFIPKDVEGGLADRLVDYYMARLVEAPTLHDKIEFEIVYSCYSLDLPQRLQLLGEHGFSKSEQHQLADSLRTLTNRIIDRDNGLWKVDQGKLFELAARREQILASGLDSVERIYWLLEDCKRYGTLPFAGLARAGFIAVQMLRSLVSVGVFDQTDYERFMSDINTVSSQLSRDLDRLDRSDFLLQYGHLRPGTYDILSPRYDEAPNDYLRAGRPLAEARKSRTPFALSQEQRRSVSRLLDEHGLSPDVDELFDFLQAGIELREYAKFVFTRNLSDSLSLFREWGAGIGYSVDELAFANIGCVRELYAGSDDPKTTLARSIEEGKLRFAETSQLWLPPLITKPDDVWAFHVPESEPNFVTQASATGHVTHPEARDKLADGIVFIPSADPGFDWLFSHPIAGLVTEYGGVNSHMAIRANELGLPAVIGAGETRFNQWFKANRLHIDCAGRRVEIFS